MGYRTAIIILSLLHIPPSVTFLAMFRDPTKTRQGNRWWVATWLRLNSLAFAIAFTRTAYVSIRAEIKDYPPSPWDNISIGLLSFTLFVTWMGFYVFLRNRYWGHR